ncbi:hypothetical protein STIAU_0747 [Stigmatella aurantiaca DW4/3-1]|uniref:Uncharacterized protein n=1 Tax=Stigmatella aurantiaca (strain DW4/3-1) TaxID=378806 RepID=Q08YU8_STIAD|nr:hypothetical protein STIAU_0747 [Stigmatella aurantiaca DW4/3-1]
MSLDALRGAAGGALRPTTRDEAFCVERGGVLRACVRVRSGFMDFSGK